MILYLVRHGEAKSLAEGVEPSLTERGTEAVVWISDWALKNEVRPVQIRHSGKLRAEQTAQILAERLRPSGGVVTVSGLSPNDDVKPLVKIVTQEEQALMLVGHLPFMGRLVSQLLVDDPEKELVRFQTASMACLLRDEDLWTLRWFVSSEQMREVNPA